MNEQEVRSIFSSNIKRLMDKAGINQKDLAERVGVSAAQVSLWCLGKNVPRSGYLARLTDVFDCQLSDLLTDKTKDSQSKKESESLPEGYESLNPANRALVDALIAQLAKSQSGSEPKVDRAQKVLSTKK